MPQFLRPWGGPWHYLALAFPLALLVLWLFPMDWTAPRTIGLIPSASRAMVIGWLLVVVFVLLSSSLSLFAWRRLTSAEAKIYLRSALAEEVDRDLSAIELRRARILRKHFK